MIHYVALFLYLGAFLLWLRTLLKGVRDRGTVLAAFTAVAAVAIHLAALALYTTEYGELPLVGLAPSLSSLALVMGLGLVATLALSEASRIGILVIPLIVILEAVAATLGVEPAMGVQDFRGAWFALHVTLAFAGYGGLSLAAAAGLLYLLQFKELKTKRLGKLFHFIPPLTTLDRLVRVGLVAGFVSLSLALALGWAWTVRFQNSLLGNDPTKVLWAVFTWFVFVAALAIRAGGGARERQSALVTVVGFCLIVASYVVVRVTMVGGGAFL